MLIVNEGDYGLDALSGLAVTYLGDGEFPNDLYVFGLRDEYDREIYLDNRIPGAHELAQVIIDNGFSVEVGLPSRPRRRPAIGLRRDVRQNRLTEAAKACVLCLFAVNNRLIFENPAEAMRRRYAPRPGDAIRVPGSSHYITRVRDDLVTTEDGMEYDIEDVRPNQAVARGHIVRSFVTTTDDEGHVVTPDDFGEIVYVEQNGFIRFRPTNPRPDLDGASVRLPLDSVVMHDPNRVTPRRRR